VLHTQPQVVDHGSSRLGRWLRSRRWRIAFGIAALEAVVVAFSHYTRWTVVGLWILAILLYLVAREQRSTIARQGVWIFAASQSLAVAAVVFAFILSWLAFVAVAVFAVIALVLLVGDRG
jgi:hypothetical protein